MNAPDKIWADGDASLVKAANEWDWSGGCWGHQPERDGEVEYIRLDLAVIKANVPEIKSLIDAAKALHIDMLERAECRIDTIRGEQYRIVNSGRTAWANFDAALRAIAEGRE